MIFFASARGWLWIVACLLAGCGRSPETQVWRGQTMGTTWSLRTGPSRPDLVALIQSHLDRREHQLSPWHKDSVISRFNAARHLDWQPVPAEVVALIELARHLAEETEGALDITLAPLIDLWGFGAEGPKPEWPTEAQIAEAKQHTGWSLLETRQTPPALRKRRPELRLNVSAVTEGFVIDELVVMLREQGLRDFVLEVGGEVAAMGRGPDGQPWWVGVQMPEAESGEALQRLPMSDLCLATSGTYRQRRIQEGKAYSHLIDPRSGHPVTHRLVSVSVLHEKAALADGYATALMVLGPERGRELAEKRGLRVFWIVDPP
jgi:FAD:protein FMN transferase